jgi:protein TonB
MLSAGKQVPRQAPARRGALVTLPVRRVAALPPPPDRRVPIATTALSLFVHGIFLIACAWQVVVTPVDPAPIKVTLLGTRPDAGGSGADAPPKPAPIVAPPVPSIAQVVQPPPKPKSKPVVAPPPPVASKPAKVRRQAQPQQSAPAPAAAVAPPAAPPAEPSTAGNGDVAGVGRGVGTGSGSGVGRGTRDGVQGDPSGSAVASYLDRLRQRLEKVKRYPLLARRRGQVGTATLQIAIDRSGHPASVRIQGSSGSQLLDDEAAEMVTRAAPFEPLPSEVTGEVLQVTVPVRFDVNG